LNKALAVLIVISLLASTPLWARTPVRAKHTAKKTSAKHGKASHHAKKTSWRNRGQKQIADDRTREIQSALAREGYFDGEPTGVMDERTKAALQKLQAENGWQTKIVPDSRALIKLGLGPDQTNVINPSTAALASPMAITSASTEGVGNMH
jgi:peptidoglycan hydrolase-like protein with peptidoglycan-binding domain